MRQEAGTPKIQRDTSVGTERASTDAHRSEPWALSDPCPRCGERRSEAINAYSNNNQLTLVVVCCGECAHEWDICRTGPVLRRSADRRRSRPPA